MRLFSEFLSKPPSIFTRNETHKEFFRVFGTVRLTGDKTHFAAPKTFQKRKIEKNFRNFFKKFVDEDLR